MSKFVYGQFEDIVRYERGGGERERMCVCDRQSYRLYYGDLFMKL